MHPIEEAIHKIGNSSLRFHMKDGSEVVGVLHRLALSDRVTITVGGRYDGTTMVGGRDQTILFDDVKLVVQGPPLVPKSTGIKKLSDLTKLAGLAGPVKSPEHPLDASDEETALGFVEGVIVNPNTLGGSPPELRALVLKHGDRTFVKLSTATGVRYADYATNQSYFLQEVRRLVRGN